MFQEAPEAQLHRGVNRHSDRGEAPDPGLLSQQRLAGGGGGGRAAPEAWVQSSLHGSSHPCPEKQRLKVRSGVHSTHGLQLEERSPGSSCLSTAPYHTHPESPSTGSRALCVTPRSVLSPTRS